MYGSLHSLQYNGRITYNSHIMPLTLELLLSFKCISAAADWPLYSEGVHCGILRMQLFFYLFISSFFIQYLQGELLSEACD